LVSLQAEEFFRRVAKASGTRMLLRQRDLHRLIEHQDAVAIDPEVALKLDAILALLQT
jgi:hypothetical protein